MDWSTFISTTGAVAVGMFVGFVVRYFLERFEDYNVKTLSALLGVPFGSTIILKFVTNFGPYKWPAYTVGLVLGLVLYQAFYAKFPRLFPMRKGTSPFVVLEAMDKLTLGDPLGHDARWERREKIRMNREAQEVLITQMTADGHLKNPVLSTGSLVSALDRRPRAGITYFYARFTTPLKKAQIVDLTFRVELEDSFTSATESIEHEILQETEQLAFEVEFPNNRLPQAKQLFRCFGQNDAELPEPKQQGILLKAAVPARMKIAETYRLEWNW